MTRAALAATRTIEILNFLAAHPAEQFTLSDLAKRLDVGVSSMHGILGVLSDAGYVERHPRLRSYRLGPSVVALGSAALEYHAAIDLARTAARELAGHVGLEVAVTAPAGDDIVILAHAGDHQARGIAVHVGQRVPLVPPLGSVFIAWGDAEPWLARARDRASMRAVLDGVRARGYSIALEADARSGLGEALDRLADAPSDAGLGGETLQGLVSELEHTDYQVVDLDPAKTYDLSMIAAPVFGTDGEVILSITLIGFAPGLSAARVAQYGEQVRDAAVVVTKRSLGRLPT
jgi:DNA-binding IclR family transcriptional regulator